MESVERRSELWRRLSNWRDAGERIALVPTMGNLHDGHLSLVETARGRADRVITSIYVNPTQFGEGEDFARYPRTLDADLARLDAVGCDLAFTPGAAQLYPFGTERAVMLRASPDLAGRLEGRKRPGHFDGVVTVVARLFAIVRPDVVVFGEKDYQQLLVIRRMTEDLGFDIEIIASRTVREESGLAMSSRNAYLASDQVEAANQLNRVLARAAELVGAGMQPFEALEREAVRDLENAGLEVDYVAIRRAADLARPRPDDTRGDFELRVLAAVHCGNTRLIDNMSVHARPARPGSRKQVS